MNEEMEEFENRLKRQPLRQIPTEWREEILATAAQAQPVRRSSIEKSTSFISIFHRHITSLLWPHPVAWGALAATWIFILMVNFSIRDRTYVVAEKTSAPSPEAVAELKQEEHMLAEMLGANALREADRPKVFTPGPRSERGAIETA